MPTGTLEDLAAEAYLYGFALVFNLSQIQRAVTSGFGSQPATPFNQFSHAHQLADPADTFVSVNNDTIYSIAMIDTSGGPVTLQVPSVGERYFVLQFVDAWTNNFAYVGTRATGPDGGTFLLTPPGWTGTVPDDQRRISLPTTVAAIVGRWACTGADDLPAVAELQAQISLTSSGPSTGSPIPIPTAGVPDELAFFEQLRTGMAAFRPADADVEHQARFAPLGLLDPTSPYVDADPTLAAALVAGQAAGKAQLEGATKSGGGTPSGWLVNPHVFDYNLDHFELGTIDAPEWKIADRTIAYLVRSAAARAGLWGNHGYEAVYAQVFVDADGQPLNGANRYEIRFPQPPPADAFWSLTMYDLPDYYLVANPIERYSIGDRTPGLETAADGSITIRMQRRRTRARRSGQLAPDPRGRLPPHVAHLHPRPVRPRRDLHAARHQPTGLSHPVVAGAVGPTTDTCRAGPSRTTDHRAGGGPSDLTPVTRPGRRAGDHWWLVITNVRVAVVPPAPWAVSNNVWGPLQLNEKS